MKRPDNLDDWPPWAREAQAKMEACGIEPDVLLAKALLLGADIKPSPNMYSKHVVWRVTRKGGGGLLGTTPELMAYRWLAEHHPSALVRAKYSP